MNKQYEAVKSYVDERYPYVDTTNYRRSGINMITADVEGADLHKWITFHLRGTEIVYTSEYVYRKQCKDSCTHQQSRQIREGQAEAGRRYQQRVHDDIEAFYARIS